MSSTPRSRPARAAPAGTPRDTRAAAQRERILAAAQKCFIEHGFHAASVACIAATARMSPGLMYRYFPSKYAILLAIIDRQLRERRLRIAALHASTDIATNVLRSFEQWRADDASANSLTLFLAMSIEAGRDQQIAEALGASDRQMRADLAAWLARNRSEGGAGLRGDLVESRAILMQCLIEGLAMRAVREPDLDLGGLGAPLRRLFDQLLAP